VGRKAGRLIPGKTVLARGENKEAYDMEHRPVRSRRANKRVLIAMITVVFVAALVAVVPAITGTLTMGDR
jgi:hypothetical protein